MTNHREIMGGDERAALAQLVELLGAFEQRLAEGSLREKVLALLPAKDLLDKLGASLIPHEIATSARARILVYFRSYPQLVISAEELALVGAVLEWARRVRELRTQYGWPILSGAAARQMYEQGELGPEYAAVGAMRPSDYILLADEQDRDAAHRWNSANQIRRGTGSSKTRILQFLRENVGREITGEELRYAARDVTEWARRVRELRTEEGWPIVTRQNGRPEMAIGVYLLEADRQSPAHDRRIPDPVRQAILTRDAFSCRRCGWNRRIWTADSPRHLELHHKVHHASGGANTKDNLITLCTACHDDWHRSKARATDLDFDYWLTGRGGQR